MVDYEATFETAAGSDIIYYVYVTDNDGTLVLKEPTQRSVFRTSDDGGDGDNNSLIEFSYYTANQANRVPFINELGSATIAEKDNDIKFYGNKDNVQDQQEVILVESQQVQQEPQHNTRNGGTVNSPSKLIQCNQFEMIQYADLFGKLLTVLAATTKVHVILHKIHFHMEFFNVRTSTSAMKCLKD